jgi:hypothetical protein
LESEWVVVVVFTVTATGAAETRRKEVARVERMALNSIVWRSVERMLFRDVDVRRFWVEPDVGLKPVEVIEIATSGFAKQGDVGCYVKNVER